MWNSSTSLREDLTNQAASPWRCEPAGTPWGSTAQASGVPDSVGRLQTPDCSKFQTIKPCHQDNGGGPQMLWQRERWTWRRRCPEKKRRHCDPEVEVGVMRPHAKGCLEPPEAGPGNARIPP